MAGEVWIGPAWAPDTYRLLTLLGGGGEGDVWKAELPLSAEGRRIVAVKIVRLEVDPEAEKLWDRSGHLLRGLSHPGLVRVTDVFRGPQMHALGEADQASVAHYVVMDHVEGATLSQWLRARPGASARERLAPLRTVAAALDEMHSGASTQVPVAHGDVKPGNVVVRSDGSAVLVDLGLTRLTDATGRVGRSAPYAAPELRGVLPMPTPEADVFAFAATVAASLTGERPPTGDDGWIDVRAVESALRASPATGNRHVVVEQVVAAMLAPPAARPRHLVSWLDAVVAALPSVNGIPAREPATVMVSPGPPAGRSDSSAPPSSRPDPHPYPYLGPDLDLGRDLFLGPDPDSYPDSYPGAVGDPHPDPHPDPEPLPDPPRRSRATAGVVIAVLAVVGLLVSGAAVLGLFRSPAMPFGEIFREPVGPQGIDPFTASVTLAERPLESPPLVDPSPEAGGVQARGDTAGLYGGTRGTPACDTGSLLRYLQTDPAKAEAWSRELDLTVDRIPAYLATLTPVVLRGDTRVTNHGYRDGASTSRQSTLQAGTAVLVDRLGVPRVRCGSGNPLTESIPQPSAVVYRGAVWRGAELPSLVVVAAASELDRLTLVDIPTGKTFDRPVGTNGQADSGIDRGGPVAPTVVVTPARPVRPTR